MMIFFVGCWYAAATVPEEIQEVVDLFPLLDVLWTAGMQFPHFEILFVYFRVCNHNFFYRMTLMMLTAKEVWSLIAACFGQLIAWTMVSTIITNGVPFFEIWTEPQSVYKLDSLDILRRYQQPMWVGYVQESGTYYRGKVVHVCISKS